jgi:hypothetical protein
MSKYALSKCDIFHEKQSLAPFFRVFAAKIWKAGATISLVFV